MDKHTELQKAIRIGQIGAEIEINNIRYKDAVKAIQRAGEEGDTKKAARAAEREMTLTAQYEDLAKELETLLGRPLNEALAEYHSSPTPALPEQP